MAFFEIRAISIGVALLLKTIMAYTTYFILDGKEVIRLTGG
jgi:hypothetical protein